MAFEADPLLELGVIGNPAGEVEFGDELAEEEEGIPSRKERVAGVGTRGFSFGSMEGEYTILTVRITCAGDMGRGLFDMVGFAVDIRQGDIPLPSSFPRKFLRDDGNVLSGNWSTESVRLPMAGPGRDGLVLEDVRGTGSFPTVLEKLRQMFWSKIRGGSAVLRVPLRSPPEVCMIKRENSEKRFIPR
jgi:hypothetical protein